VSLQLIMHILLSLGILAMAATFQRRGIMLKKVFAEDKDSLRKLLWQPLQELLLAFIFTFAGFFFAKRIFGGHRSLLLAFAIAGAVAAMSSIGAYCRFRDAEEMRSLQMQTTSALLRLQRISCLGTFFLLVGLLVAMAYLLGLGKT
jgi:hypothetical protein